MKKEEKDIVVNAVINTIVANQQIIHDYSLGRSGVTCDECGKAVEDNRHALNALYQITRNTYEIKYIGRNSYVIYRYANGKHEVKKFTIKR